MMWVSKVNWVSNFKFKQMKLSVYLCVLAVFLLVNCNNNPEKNFDNDKTFPDVKNLNEYPGSVFLPTLETEFETNKNGIYAASLLMAWDEIKKYVKDSIVEFESLVLEQMNLSNSYLNVLKPNEYSTEIQVENDIITAKAYFKKSLPFQEPFIRFNNPLNFQGNEVACFGKWGSGPVSIYYYNNDADFVLKLYPEDENHEIFLIKTNFNSQVNLKTEFEKFNKNRDVFVAEWNEQNDWKHYLNDEDEIKIPVFEFNIETNYTDIENTIFTTDKGFERKVLEAYQRTAFVLNENGAEIESEAEIEATEAVEDEMEMPKPKKLILDKEFILLLKRVDANYPYFAMFVANAELMDKFKK